MSKKPMISIVDDDQSVREGTKDLLESMGFCTRSFESAGDFLQSGRASTSSCLITDMRMPGMSGLELHAHLAASGNRIPTILVTAFPNSADRTRALEAGVCCYLPKPFDEKELLNCIRSALASARSGDVS